MSLARTMEQMHKEGISSVNVNNSPRQNNNNLHQADKNLGIIIIPGVFFSIFIPPFWKWYFSPSHNMSFFDTYHGLFALILPDFAFILPFYSPFSPFLCPFFLFLLHFPLFLFLFLYFFPKWHRLTFSPPGGGGIFQYIDPWIILWARQTRYWKSLPIRKRKGQLGN